MQKIVSSFVMKTGIFFLFFLFLPFYTVLASGDKIKVVATIAPLADFARQVGGNKVEVVLLLPPGASPHTYEPTPKVVHEISQARLFLKIGSGLEFWADRMIQAASANIEIIDSSAGVALIKDIYHSHEHGQGHDLGRDEGVNGDPHIWLDPLICIEIIAKIESALSKADPLHASYYKSNASAYA